MVTYKAIIAAVGAVESDIKKAVENIEAIPGVKVLEATARHIIVQFDADMKHLASNPALQRQMDILRGDVRAEIEKIGGITVKECIAFEVGLIKKIVLFIKKIFKK